MRNFDNLCFVSGDSSRCPECIRENLIKGITRRIHTAPESELDNLEKEMRKVMNLTDEELLKTNEELLLQAAA